MTPVATGGIFYFPRDVANYFPEFAAFYFPYPCSYSIYGDILHELTVKGQLIGGNDLLIAAHARALGMILVTNNTREFERVSNLRIENWVD